MLCLFKILALPIVVYIYTFSITYNSEEQLAYVIKVFFADTIEVSLQSFHNKLWGEHLHTLTAKIGDKMNEVSKTKERIEFGIFHESFICWTKTCNHVHVLFQFWRWLIWSRTQTPSS